MKTTRVFLDLEETIIESWGNPVLVNHQRINKFLKKLDITHVGIFSFAIWDENDKRNFDRFGIKDTIENALEVRINNVLTIPDIAKEVFWKQGMVISINEFITIWGKQRAFIDWAMMQPRFDEGDMEFILIDDVVQNLTILDRDSNGSFKITLFNVENI